MMKIGRQEIISPPYTVNSGSQYVKPMDYKPVEDDSFFSRLEKILPEINKMLSFYQNIRSGQNKDDVLPNEPEPVNNTPRGMNMDKLVEFLNQFLGNLEKQGRGNEPIGQVIAKADVTVSQCRKIVEVIKGQIAK